MNRAILHVIEDLKPESGGPTTVVVELARQQAKCGHRVSVVCLQGPTGPEQRAQLEASFGAVGVRLVDLSANAVAPSRSMLASSIRELRPDLMHLHGVWSGLLRRGASEARRNGVQYVISTHGMLHPDVLKHGRWKKWAYLTLFHGLIGGSSEVLALNEEERAYVAARFSRPASVLANGIDASSYRAANAGDFLGQHPQLRKESFALFVGRLHSIKGLDQLVRSFARARTLGFKSHLVIAGPDSGELESLRSLVAELDVASTTHFVGPLYGTSKLSALAACSMFVHRPRFEGFGLSVLEALATGRPVVTTRRCRLDGAEVAGALRIADDTDEAFAAAMVSLERDPAASAALGARASEWACARFDWASVARDADAVYDRAWAKRSR